MSPIVEFVDEVGGVYFRSILIQAGVRVPQHVHDYDHATYIGSGSAQLYVNGEARESYRAGQAVLIKAHMQHEFQALENDTRLVCVHNVHSADSIKEKGL